MLFQNVTRPHSSKACYELSSVRAIGEGENIQGKEEKGNGGPQRRRVQTRASSLPHLYITAIYIYQEGNRCIYDPRGACECPKRGGK